MSECNCITPCIPAPITMTIPEVVKRHAGISADNLRDMCLRRELRALKIGKAWHIPVTELDRVFLGKRVGR